MVEYILIVVVTVIIVLGLAQRMYKPLGDFVEGMMGTYVACLLETGELPALGGEEGSECKPPIMAGGDGSTDGQNDQKKNEVKKSDPPASGGSDDDSDKVTETDVAGGSNSSSRSRSSEIGRPPILNNQASGGRDGSEGGKRIQIALDEGGGGAGFFDSSGGYGSSYRKKERYIPVQGDLSDELKKSQKDKEGDKTTKTALDRGSDAMTRKKLTVEPPKTRKTAGLDDEVKGLDIGDIVKYIMIAAIIIILLLLIGGQALQLSKSWEKGE